MRGPLWTWNGTWEWRLLALHSGPLARIKPRMREGSGIATSWGSEDDFCLSQEGVLG